MLIHQSDLAAWSRCPAMVGYKRAGLPDKQTSAAAFGSVMHHAIEVFERERYTIGFDAALQKALETFVFYWNPLNIEAITDPVENDGWLPRQGYSELRARGLDSLRKYADLIRFDDNELLATEYEFAVPIDGTWDDDLGQPHVLAGSVDRLAARFYLRKLACCIDDWKTGKEQKFLRHNVQGTAYCYASTKREFWVGWLGQDGFGPDRGEELYARFMEAGRRFTWVNLRTFKTQDGGWRGPADYDRLAIAVEQMVASIKADIFPLSLSGENCKYCPYRAVCGVTGLPSDSYGDPTKKGV